MALVVKTFKATQKETRHKTFVSPAIRVKRCEDKKSYLVNLGNKDYCIVEMPSRVIWDLDHIAQLSINQELEKRIMDIIDSFNKL